MRFFPSLTMEQISALTPQETRYYIQAMNRINAKERLELMDAVQYHTLVPKDKRKAHRDVSKQAFPEAFAKRVVKTTDLELF